QHFHADHPVFSCSKSEQKQLNTWVSFQSAEQPLLGQFSVSGNNQLLHGDETYVSGDAGYTGAAKRPEHAERDVIWSIAARPSSYKQHGEGSVLYRVKRKIEYAKAQLRAKVEHPFQVIKVRFNHRKVRYRGLEKNTAQLFSLFGLANLMLAKRYLQQAAG
ncbi:transposase, partial [Pseudomonas syringae]|uniref:transposase n=1 Tax=Pseudomonas syringae TaxID=317 RepID=UPI0021561AC6